MTKKVFLILLAVVLALSVGIVGCTTPAEEEEEEPEVKTLKIGCTLPLNVPFGIEAKKCWEVIIPKFNEAGGLVVKGQRYNIDFIIYDDKYTPEGGRAGVERLVYEDKVKHIVGMIGSGPTVAALTVTEPEKVIVISGCGTDKIVFPEVRYGIRTTMAAAQAPTIFGFAMKAYPDLKSTVMIAPDTETGHADSARLIGCAKAYGLEVLGELYYPAGTTDFSPIATKVKSLNPDMVNFPASMGGTDFGLQLKSLHESGWRGVQINGHTVTMDEVKAVCTKEQMEGVLCMLEPTDIPSPPKLTLELKEAYMEKYGTWSSIGLMWVNAWDVFVAAVQKADSLDPDDIIAAMEGLECETVSGRAIMVRRPDLGTTRCCDFVVSMHFGEIKDGELGYGGSLPAEDVIKACEKIFGGKWK